MNLPCKRLQVDEAWAFCYAKQKNVPTAKAAPEGAGDIWTWVGLDAESKLAVSWYVGGRDSEAAMIFMDDLAKRLANRVQLTSDGHKAYLGSRRRRIRLRHRLRDAGQGVRPGAGRTAPLQPGRCASARSSIASKAIPIPSTSARLIRSAKI